MEGGDGRGGCSTRQSTHTQKNADANHVNKHLKSMQTENDTTTARTHHKGAAVYGQLLLSLDLDVPHASTVGTKKSRGNAHLHIATAVIISVAKQPMD